MTEESPEAQGKPTVSFDDFMKLDLKVGKVVEVAEHPNADKLLVLQIDMGGGENRQVIAGLKPYLPAESLMGKDVIVVANLAPRKMRGMESNGMVLAASWMDGDERHVVPLTTSQDTPAGAEVS